MLYEKPNLITDSIVQKIVNENQIHLYGYKSSNKIGNLLCLLSITIIVIYLVNKYLDKQNKIKKYNSQY